MALVRWIASHLILVVVVVALGAAFLYRDELSAELGFDFDRFWPTAETPLVKIKPIEKAETAPVPAPAPAPAPAAKAPAPAPVAAPAPAKTGASDLKTGWADARRAFAAGDAEKSVGIYQGLIAANPDTADLRGELGNILLSQGRTEDAAEQYYQAGLAMLRGSEKFRANVAVGILNGIDPQRAAQLREAIFEAMRNN